MCEFCDRRYLDRDELFRHLRREHYYCHFCDADGLNHYYAYVKTVGTSFRLANLQQKTSFLFVQGLRRTESTFSVASFSL